MFFPKAWNLSILSIGDCEMLLLGTLVDTEERIDVLRLFK